MPLSTPTPPKVSFIPKTSLVQEETFLERRRPRSLLIFIAIFTLTATVGAHAGLTFFGRKLARDAEAQTKDIQAAQVEFAEAKSIADARAFTAQAKLAQELLDSHYIISPVFDFLTDATLSSIFYESFSFQSDGSTHTIQLKGEAPSYASLANQSDELAGYKGKEIVNYAIRDISLTRFGGVSFSLKIVFNPEYLSYSNQQRQDSESSAVSGVDNNGVQSIEQVNTTGSGEMTTVSTLETSEGSGVGSGTVVSGTQTAQNSLLPEVQVTFPAPTTSGGSEVPAVGGEKTSFWSWFKFW